MNWGTLHWNIGTLLMFALVAGLQRLAEWVSHSPLLTFSFLELLAGNVIIVLTYLLVRAVHSMVVGERL